MSGWSEIIPTIRMFKVVANIIFYSPLPLRLEKNTGVAV